MKVIMFYRLNSLNSSWNLLLFMSSFVINDFVEAHNLFFEDRTLIVYSCNKNEKLTKN